jgi:hypothetical protein
MGWEGRKVLDEMESFFDPKALLRTIRAEATFFNFDCLDPMYAWSVRALGVRRVKEGLGRLVQLSHCEARAVSLVAEKSLEDYTGLEADQALADCLLGWRYDAYIRAGRALLQRNKALLNNILSSTSVPKDSRYQVGLLLAKCENPLAVSILCDEVGGICFADHEMFECISHLAGPRHREVIESLPKRVRAEQVNEAQAVVERFYERFGQK